MPDRLAVRLLRSPGNLGKVPIGSEADRTADCGPDVIADRPLDRSGKCGWIAPLRFVERTRKLVDRFDLIDRHDRGYFADQRVMSPSIKVRLLRDQHEVAANAACLVHHHDVFDAVRLGFARAGNDARFAPLIGNDTDRTSAQFRVAQLLDRRKEAVKV